MHDIIFGNLQIQRSEQQKKKTSMVSLKYFLNVRLSSRKCSNLPLTDLECHFLTDRTGELLVRVPQVRALLWLQIEELLPELRLDPGPLQVPPELLRPRLRRTQIYFRFSGPMPQPALPLIQCKPTKMN